MPSPIDPQKQVQIPCEIDVTADISPSRIRSAFAQINIPRDRALKILANQQDINRWCNEGVVVRTIVVNGQSPDGVALAERGLVKMCGYEMVPTPDMNPGKLALVYA